MSVRERNSIYSEKMVKWWFRTNTVIFDCRRKWYSQTESFESRCRLTVGLSCRWRMLQCRWWWRYVPVVAVKHWTVLCLFLSLTVRSTVTVHSASAWNCVGSVLFLVLLRRLPSLVSREGVVIQLPVVCCYTVQLIQSLSEKDRKIQHVNVRCLFLFVWCCGIVIM